MLLLLLPVCVACQLVATRRHKKPHTFELSFCVFLWLKKEVWVNHPVSPLSLVHPHSKHRESPLSLVQNPVLNLKKVSNYVLSILARRLRFLFQFVVTLISYLRY